MKNFETIHQKKDVPDNLPELEISDNLRVKVYEFITEHNMCPSKSEAKRVIKGGGVSVNGNKVSDPFEEVNLSKGDIIKVGKRKFLKII